MKINKRTTAFLAISIACFLLGVGLYKSLINNRIKFSYPLNNAVFPAEIAAPTFKWSSDTEANTIWKITLRKGWNTILYTDTTNVNYWRPDKETWDSIKLMSQYQKITLTVKHQQINSFSFTQIGKADIFISPDSLDAPILYREIPLPFIFAEENMELACYSLYNVASYKPPHKVLDGFNVCGNCHSSTRDGGTIALDFDASSRDKGGFFIAKIDTITEFNKQNYLSWSKFRNESTFGLFSKISWNGRYVVTTIRDRVVSKKVEFIHPSDLAYSQVFFPVNGVLAIYDREKGTLKELPGANDLKYVQSNAVWTPDDKHIIFARAEAIPYPDTTVQYKSFIEDKELIEAYVTGKKKMKYDLYIIPFNDGEGGEALPVKGASQNNKSNYFPAVSPDGKWLAYCQSDNLMMLRPDSRIHMTSLETGKSGKLKSNFASMNSWHSWSPNGKWLVFSSKAFSVYTDLFLTHIDKNGKASIPILLENSHAANRAVNYPEFINRSPDFTFKMDYNYVNLRRIMDVIEKKKDTTQAKELLVKYLKQEQFSTPEEYLELSQIYQIFGDQTKADYYLKLHEEKSITYYKIDNKNREEK